MAILDDVRQYLTIQGAVSTFWPCYIGFLPDNSDQAIGLFEYPGLPAETLAREIETVSFQVRVRGARSDYATVRAKWEECFNLLQDAQASSGSSPSWLPGVVFIQAKQFGPIHLNDEKGRPNFESNFRVKRYR